MAHCVTCKKLKKNVDTPSLNRLYVIRDEELKKSERSSVKLAKRVRIKML